MRIANASTEPSRKSSSTTARTCCSMTSPPSTITGSTGSCGTTPNDHITASASGLRSPSSPIIAAVSAKCPGPIHQLDSFHQQGLYGLGLIYVPTTTAGDAGGSNFRFNRQCRRSSPGDLMQRIPYLVLTGGLLAGLRGTARPGGK